MVAGARSRAATWLGRITLAAAAAAAAAAPVAADYLFRVPREIVVVTVNADSSLDIDYRITFECSYAGKTIDVVDIGFPSRDYELSSVTADIDGVPATDIRKSEYIDVGVEVHLPPTRRISPGTSGTLHVHGRNPRMVFVDDADENYASCVFSPTWFHPDFTLGSTHLTMAFVFPPGVAGEQSRWHDDHGGRPTHMFIKEGRVHYVWDLPHASPSQQYFFGISFPRTAVAEVRSRPKLQWLGPAIRKAISFVLSVSGCLIPVGIIALIAIGTSVNNRRRRMRYLPPKCKAEGVGIKRGLTAPEAALLLEVPLNKILTMILFGLAKKGAVAVTSQEPLLLKKQGLLEGDR